MINYLKFFLLVCFIFCPIFKNGKAQSTSSEIIQGRVCEEAFYDLKTGCAIGAEGIEGIMVSNQREVILTDENGFYELPVEEGMVIFVSKPAEYQ